MLATATSARGQDPTRVVISRAAIEAAGWFNLGEVLVGATGWHRSTLDAVSFFAVADGLPPGAAVPAAPEYLVLVDGQRVGLDVLGAKLLELLPISPAQIESVTVTRAPRLVAGTVAGRGVVEFHTREVRRGPSVAGAWHSGNIIGDPGPYRFTPLATENVDRLGPYNFAFAGFAGAGWDVGAGARQGSSHTTHPEIRRRFDPALFEPLGENKWAPYDVVHARAGGTLLGGRHDVVAGRGWLSGPVFFPLVGVEQWSRGTADHVGGAGSIRRGAASVDYQLAHSALDVRELPSPFPFVAAHARARTAGVLEVGVADQTGRRVRLGAALTRWRVQRDGASAARSDATLFASLTGALGGPTAELSGAIARSSGGPVVAKGLLAAHTSLGAATTLAVSVGYVQHASGDDGTWIDRVLLGLDTLGRDRGARGWADVGVARRLGGGWLAEAAVGAGLLDDVDLLSSDGTSAGVSSTVGVGEARAGLSREVTPRLPVVRLAYRYATPLGGDGALRVALRATPAHSLDGQIVAAVATDFRLGAVVYIASRAQWAALRGAAATPVTLPAVSRLDVSAEKWFWQRRVRTQMLVRNLLNQPERYHPLGADFPLRVHLTLGLELP
jgi:hypothetical protein